MSFWSSIRGRLLITVLLLNAITAVSYGVYIYTGHRSDVNEGVNSRLFAAAYAAAGFASEDTYDKAINGVMDQELFKALNERAYKFCASTNIEFIYTLVESEKGFHFVVDTPEESEMEQGALEKEPLYLYEDASPKLAEALRTNEIQFDEYVDEWGSHRSIFVPIETDNGVRFVAGADMPLESINRTLAAALYSALIIGAAGFALSAIVGWIAIAKFLNPISLARSAVKTIARDLDFVARLNENPDEIGALCADLNLLLGEVQKAITKAIDSADENASISSQLDASGALIHKQAKANLDEMVRIVANGSETNKLLQQMRDEIEDVKESMNVAAEKLYSSREEIGKVAGLVQRESEAQTQLSERLNQLANEADSVKKVLGVIGDIADQTNMLALNAAIEAARAGDAGRGFAVVADEVRKLAERTQKSLSETSATITAITQSIGDAASSMEQNADEFRLLLESAMAASSVVESGAEEISRTKERLAKAAEDSREIVQATRGVLASVDEISSRTNESSVSIKEIADLASHLSRQSELLRIELSKFQA
ncbi:MAG: methyl-accepting chemotaxis protein [Helicobacteraceae bacterium]|jgi:methyl-accepting chemotaxis protein|nr:methyl-accepting chemotaxis protein [Helicobacteraceae bacterium]